MRVLPLSLALGLAACVHPDPQPGVDSTDTGDTGDAAADAWVREPTVCAAPEVALASSGSGLDATTAHYVLHIEGFDEAEARNLAALAETAWQGFAAFFDAEVAGPFEVHVAADADGFAADLAAAGVGNPEGAGGYYDPGSGGAFLYRQPTAYYSRVLLLHELTHQYQGHVSGLGGLPFWYVEGVAESVGRHHWDGACLELRVRPLLSWEDAAADARAELDDGAALADVLSGTDASRPIAQELVRMLSSDPAYAAAFAAWRAAVAAGEVAADADSLAAAVGSVASLADALPAFVDADQEPMAPVYLDWIPQADDAALGFATYSGAARVKQAVSGFAMHVELSDGAVGTVYGYDPASGDLELALVDAGGGVSRFAVIGGQVAWDTIGAVAPGTEVDWSQTAGADTTAVTIGADTVELPRSLPAAGGLALYGATATFDALRWE